MNKRSVTYYIGIDWKNFNTYVPRWHFLCSTRWPDIFDSSIGILGLSFIKIHNCDHIKTTTNKTLKFQKQKNVKTNALVFLQQIHP